MMSKAATRTKRNSVVNLKFTSGGKLPSLSSGRLSSITVRSELDRKQLLEEHTSKQNVTKFVYSEAVETAFRRDFLCSAFGPRSAKVRSMTHESSIEVAHVQELYHDFLFIKKNLESNHRHIQKIQKELEQQQQNEPQTGADTSPGKLPRISLRNALALAKMRGRVSSLKPGSDSDHAKEDAMDNNKNSVLKLPSLANNPGGSLIEAGKKEVSSKPLTKSRLSPSICGH